ncbi:MAG: hypothetical protein Q4F84_08065 [Fibrobacter sp.]|nr:hypothetical protein [Fibrobacter sp.]
MWENAFLFPGQGSQEVGMGQDLFDCHDPFFTSLVELGSEITNCNLKNLCLNGPDSSLMTPDTFSRCLLQSHSDISGN